MHFDIRSDEIRFLERVKQGDREAEKQLYDFYFVALCTFLDGFTFTSQQSEDIAAKVLLKWFKRKRKFFSIELIKSYLYTSARNEFRTHLRIHKRHNKWVEHIQSEEPAPEKDQLDLLIEAELLQFIDHTIDQLHPQRKKIITMIKNGYKTREIARELNISPQTVLNTKQATIGLIREALAKMEMML